MTVIYCANCEQISTYAYNVTPSHSIYYCPKHLPKFLNSPQYVGVVVKVSDLPTATKESTSKTTKKKSSTAPVVEEAPAIVEEEEVVIDEVVEELPTPEVSEDK